jgi:ribosome biogenesis GTPase
MPLAALGWNSRLAAAAAPHLAAGLTPFRVAREDRDRYFVLGEAGERPAVLAGRVRQRGASSLDLPAVGDWVVAEAAPDGPARILAVLPRGSAFVRHRAGEETAVQVVAANIETVFLVNGLDGDFNPRRIERYVTAAWESGAQPVLVLNKADLAAAPEARTARVAEAAAAAPGVEVVVLSALAGEGVGALARWLVPGHTIALLGSSGVGKSTLVNALVGAAVQATQAVRGDDSRGRHTTTHRELLRLPGGAWLLDTPGMRELQLWADDDTLEPTFPEITALAARCRFGDCSHAHEPGCAVLAALAEGALDEARYTSWQKLQRELEWLATRQDARARAELQAKWRAISKSMRHHPKATRWRGEGRS